MSRNKELQNQLRVALTQTDFSRLSMEQFAELYKAFTDEFGQGKTDFMHRGRLDTNIVYGAMVEGVQRLFSAVRTSEDFKRALDLQEALLAHDPLNISFNKIPQNQYCLNLMHLARAKDLDLNDMVRQSTLNLKVNINRTGFLFPEMIRN